MSYVNRRSTAERREIVVGDSTPAESEQRYRQIIQNLPAAVYACDAEGRITMYNGAAVDLWGRKPEHDLWCGSYRIYQTDGTPMPLDRCPMALALKEGRRIRGAEIVIEREDGTRRNVLAHPEPLWDAAGRVMGAVNMLVDITERKQAEAELAATKDNLALQVEALTRLHELAMRLAGALELRPALQAILETLVEIHHADYGLLSLYDSASGALPDAASLGLDKTALETLSHTIPSANAGASNSAFATKKRVVVEDTETDPQFIVHREIARAVGFRAVHSTPILTHSGDILGVVSVHFKRRRQPTLREMQLADMCARHAAEVIETVRSQHTLRESEERFRQMADSAPVMVWVTDPGGRCTFLSKSWHDFTGRLPEAPLETAWIAALHPDDRTGFHDAFTAANQSRERFRREYRLRRRDGKYRWAIDVAVPRFAADGQFLGYIGSVIDITERKLVEDALKEADRRKNEFLANMSHEIRSPMTGVLGYADILLDRLTDPDDLECVRTIKESGNYLLELINDVLDLTKIESGKLAIKNEQVMLPSLLSEIHFLMAVRAQEKKLPLLLKYVGAVPERIASDRTRLRQILINLVGNAIKFTERGEVEIIVKMLDQGAKLQVEVVDTGIGIAPVQQEQLFHPFTQADSSATRAYGGTGLGLAITKRLIDGMGGEIEVESKIGYGSRFRVTLPIRSEGLYPPAMSTSSRETFSPGERISARVLVVEDRREIRNLISYFVEEAGGRVTALESGSAALKTLEEDSGAYDIVLMDIQMPLLDGYETTRRLRAKGFNKPIIALTAGAMKGHREKCFDAGCDDFLTKPLDKERLIAAITRYTVSSSLEGGNKSMAERKYRILVVDDNAVALKATICLLQMSGHQVVGASDGRSALEAARQFSAEKVLVDLNLPGMDGYDLMKQLRQLDGMEKTVFIAVTGYGPEYRERAREAGFHHYVTKPIDMKVVERLFSQD